MRRLCSPTALAVLSVPPMLLSTSTQSLRSHRCVSLRVSTVHMHSGPSLFESTAPRLAPKPTHPYQCGECGKAFRLLNALNHHILTKHAGKASAMVADSDGHLTKVGDVGSDRSGESRDLSDDPEVTHTPSQAAVAPEAPTATSPSSGATSTSHNDEPTSDGGDDGSTPAPAASEKEQVFVCTICQKTFRLEAALQHHYQAKHNTQMPSVACGVPSGATGGGSPMTDAGRGVALGAGLGMPSSPTPTATEFVRQQETLLPDAPAYHLGVAPNAPEESDLAVHWRCVNSCVLVGTVTEWSEGYVFEDHVLQLTIATRFEAPSPGDPDKDFHTVRVYGDSFWRPFAETLKVGDTVAVNGRLRMVPQFDDGLKRYYHYPVVQVMQGTGLLTRLSH